MSDSERPMNVHGSVRWSAAAKYAVQTVEMVTSLYVARIVAPECYGLLGMAVVVTGFLQIFQSLGFGSALIQRKEISDVLTSSLFFVNLAFTMALAVLLTAGSPAFSRLYGDDRVGPIVAVMSLTFIVSSFSLIPTAILTRRMAFQRLAWIDIATSAVRAVTVVVLAHVGWGVWALVWSSIAGTAAQTLLSYLVCDWRPRWMFRWSEVRSVIGFGAHLTGFSVFNYFARNADNLLIGAYLGAGPLGFYSLARRTLALPQDAVVDIVTRVTFPAFARMQDDDKRFAAAFLRCGGAIALMTFPMMLGLAAVSELFVSVVLGPKWMPAVDVMWLLALVGMARSVLTPTGTLYLAKGRADWLFGWAAFSGVIYVAGYVFGLRWGTWGVAMSYAVLNAVLFLPTLWASFRLVSGLLVRDYLRAIVPSAAAAGVMCAAVIVFRTALTEAGVRDLYTLFSSVAVGIATYVGLIAWIRPSGLADFARLVPWPRTARRRTAAVEER